MIAGLLAFALGQLLDLLTTAWGYSLGLTDGNPTVRYTIERHGFEGLALVKLATLPLLAVSCLILRTQNHKAGRICAWLFAVPQLLVPLWNVFVLMR
jgi:hypothetical protein